MKFTSPHFLALIFQLLHEAPDAGAGSGGGGASSPDDGAGAGDQGRTAYDDAGRGGGRSSQRGFDSRGGRQSQGGGATPYKLTDDSLVDLGDGKGVKWSEAKGKYVPKDQYDRVQGALDGSRDMLLREGQRLDGLAAELMKRERALQSGNRPQAQQAQADIAEELAGLGIVDGPTVAKIVKNLREQNLVPLAQAFSRLQGQLTAQAAELATLKGAAGPLTEQNQSRQFEEHIATALTKIPEIKGLSQPVAALAAKHPVIKDILSDLWLSYDPKSWKMDDFYKMASDRIAGLIAMVREDQKHAVASAQEKKRKFFAQGPASHPSGQGRQYQHMSGRQIAQESGLFDRTQQQA